MGLAHQRWSPSQLPFSPLDTCRRYLPTCKLEVFHVQGYISQITNNIFFCLLNLQWKCDRNKPSTRLVRFLNPQITKTHIMKTQSCWSSCNLVAELNCWTSFIFAMNYSINNIKFFCPQNSYDQFNSYLRFPQIVYWRSVISILTGVMYDSWGNEGSACALINCSIHPNKL
jgi:hypothetical protein